MTDPAFEEAWEEELRQRAWEQRYGRAPADDEHGNVFAAAKLSRGPSCWLWTVRRCPFCGKGHQHGGGTLDGDPRALLGHRVAHCVGTGSNDGYVLVDGWAA